MPMKLVINGCAGRLGRILVRKVHESAKAQLAGGLEVSGSHVLGKDLGTLIGKGKIGIKVSDDPLDLIAKSDGIIDFSTPQTSVEVAELAAQARIVHVIGTTGFTPQHLDAIKAASRHATIIKSGNMSLGVNLLSGLVQRLAGILDENWDIEIGEMHHRHKIDAPSGTALLLGEAAAKGRNIDFERAKTLNHNNITAPRKTGAIGFSSARGGSVFGDHEVIFAGDDEIIKLSHRAQSRDIFAQGALVAALWGQNTPPGLYTMAHVLGL